MGHKAVETTGNINNASGPGTARNRQCSGGSRSFSKEISLKDEEHSGLPSEVNNDQLRGSSRLILLQLQEVAQELNINHSTVI